MNVLIIFTHPNPKSFNKAILEALIKGLTEANVNYKVIDLYKENFDPVFNLNDFEQYTGKIPDNIKKYHNLITWANIMIFLAPIWWWNYPAILKGWFDRVLSPGFAYSYDGSKGLLTHQKVIFINTTLASEKEYESSGIRNAINIINKAVFKMCGIDNVETILLYKAAISEKLRTKYLNDIYQLGKNIIEK